MTGFDDYLARIADRAGATAAGITNADGAPVLDPVATPAHLRAGRDLDRERRERVVPDFAHHPIPEVARFLWLMAREAGCPPPWNVRVSTQLCAKYTMARVAQALSPHAKIVMTPDSRSPAPMVTWVPAPLPDDPLHQEPQFAIEFVWTDNGRSADGSHLTAAAARGGSGGGLWVPDDLGRTTRTITDRDPRTGRRSG